MSFTIACQAFLIKGRANDALTVLKVVRVAYTGQALKLSSLGAGVTSYIEYGAWFAYLLVKDIVIIYN